MFPRIRMVAGEDRPTSFDSTEPAGEGTAREETAPGFRTPKDPPDAAEPEGAVGAGSGVESDRPLLTVKAETAPP